MAELTNNYLIVGLGNPGLDYQETRHNAGFLLVDRLISRYDAREEGGMRDSLLWSAQVDDTRIFLMKPLTYMNLSGRAVGHFLQKTPLQPHQILVAYDDVAISLGLIRIRKSGSAGGQKGMRHIIETLGTDQIPRLRIGIDSSYREGLPLPEFVLQPFHEKEVDTVRLVLDQAENAADMWTRDDIAAVMGQFNKKTPPESRETTINGGERSE